MSLEIEAVAVTLLGEDYDFVSMFLFILGCADIITDFLVFFSIRNSDEINTAVKYSVLAFAIYGVLLQFLKFTEKEKLTRRFIEGATVMFEDFPQNVLLLVIARQTKAPLGTVELVSYCISALAMVVRIRLLKWNSNLACNMSIILAGVMIMLLLIMT